MDVDVIVVTLTTQAAKPAGAVDADNFAVYIDRVGLEQPTLFFYNIILSSLRNYLYPIAIWILYKIDTHGFILETNAPHLLVMVVCSFKIVYYKS